MVRIEWEGKEEDVEKILFIGKYNFWILMLFKKKKLYVCIFVLKYVGIYLFEYNNIILVYYKSLRKV